jgi:hypothetical protein
MGGMVYGVDGLKVGGGGGGMGYGNCACAGLIVPPNRATNPATKNFPSVIRFKRPIGSRGSTSETSLGPGCLHTAVGLLRLLQLLQRITVQLALELREFEDVVTGTAVGNIPA